MRIVRFAIVKPAREPIIGYLTIAISLSRKNSWPSALTSFTYFPSSLSSFMVGIVFRNLRQVTAVVLAMLIVLKGQCCVWCKQEYRNYGIVNVSKFELVFLFDKEKS